MYLLLGGSDFFSVTPEVHADPNYRRAHEGLAAFVRHAVDYIENHANELRFLGVPLRAVYVKSVLLTAAVQAVTLAVSVMKSVNTSATP